MKRLPISASVHAFTGYLADIDDRRLAPVTTALALLADMCDEAARTRRPENVRALDRLLGARHADLERCLSAGPVAGLPEDPAAMAGIILLVSAPAVYTSLPERADASPLRDRGLALWAHLLKHARGPWCVGPAMLTAFAAWRVHNLELADAAMSIAYATRVHCLIEFDRGTFITGFDDTHVTYAVPELRP
ncbi:hypothetical protein Afil01_31330 [Actinorhabdospora filicis]|uniref:Uncharacterized protein n=1 Tax=Actinorhabdospora filicis TaxID=1785913 RepID=A0A9W6SPF7_9ACTN|nr:DUF4192 family protein [Actinorhabdospora filicis]GLZ78326.1 hypothetical protein Afil01_31330 [Actinorhabdospora filicis]